MNKLKQITLATMLAVGVSCSPAHANDAKVDECIAYGELSETIQMVYQKGMTQMDILKSGGDIDILLPIVELAFTAPIMPTEETKEYAVKQFGIAMFKRCMKGLN